MMLSISKGESEVSFWVATTQDLPQHKITLRPPSSWMCPLTTWTDTPLVRTVPGFVLILLYKHLIICEHVVLGIYAKNPYKIDFDINITPKNYQQKILEKNSA